MKRFKKHKANSLKHQQESITPIIVAFFVTYHFLFYWYLLFALLTSTCYPFNDYMRVDVGWSVIESAFWGYFFLAVWSLLEFIKGLQRTVSDVWTCLIGNGLVMILTVLSFLGLSEQQKYMALQSSTVNFSYLQATAAIETSSSTLSVQSDWRARYCRRIHERNRLPEF